MRGENERNNIDFNHFSSGPSTCGACTQLTANTTQCVKSPACTRSIRNLVEYSAFVGIRQTMDVIVAEIEEFEFRVDLNRSSYVCAHMIVCVFARIFERSSHRFVAFSYYFIRFC